MTRIKNFISVIPLLEEDKFSRTIYLAEKGSQLKTNVETRFPIVATIAAYASPGEKIKVTYILTNHDYAKSNLTKLFIPELSDLKANMNLEVEEVKIKTAFNQSVDTKLKLFADIIESLGDNEDLFACTTYGNKPTAQVLPMALNYAYRTRNNVGVECVVYGEKDFKTGKVRIYDMTSLFYMDEIVNNLADAKVKNPIDTIKKLLELK